jgi:hypothetical protein
MADQYAVLYRAALEQAAQAGESIMAKVLAAARQSLKDHATQMRGFAERDHFELTLKLLDSNARMLCERYPQALTTAFKQTLPVVGDGVAALASLHFEQLELMDSAQVHERVELARAQQSAMLAADAALAELNTYICATLGMKAVQPERNPLRPELYVRALQSLLAQTQVPSRVQMDWLQHMSSALGKELSVFYETLSRQLHSEGVTAAGYAVVRTHDGTGPTVGSRAEQVARASSPASAPHRLGELARERDDTVLTLDRLRRLLVGELDQGPAEAGLESFAAQFSREFESGGSVPPAPDFEATVPAAFETLREMEQVDRMMERIGNRRHAPHAGGAAGLGSPQAVRDHLRGVANGLGQALSLEVVVLMVENIARDVRLLDPIRDAVKNLEPALLRLAMVDPRFFSDKQHPARRLLQEITHRSLAYDTVDAPGFTGFLEPLQRAMDSLAGRHIEDAQPFEQALQTLVRVWDELKPPRQLEKAVQALQHAEQRNFLAAKIAREVAAGPDAGRIPEGVLDFVCGPWAQVVAHARLADSAGSDDPGQYRELVVALFWSAQPELTRKNIAKLTRLVPKLLGKLREGLDLIDYPSLKTSAFFELLMKLHQQAFRPVAVAAKPTPRDSLLASLFEDADSWVAPAEAKVSGFMEAPAEMAQSRLAVATATQAAAPTQEPARLATMIDKPIAASAGVSLPVGAWVELLVNGAWIRTQLLWASPHDTLFLFTSAYGSTQSMTRRSRDKLLAAGSMRILSGQPFVDSALDAVLQTAMLNSIDIKL